MKHCIILFFGIFFSMTLFAQEHDHSLTSKFVSGCPKEIESIKKQLGLKDISYTSLETGVDSIRIVFGKMIQGAVNGYWISIYLNNNLKTFSTVQLEKNKSLNVLSNNIDIEFDHSKKISLYLTHNLLKNEITYAWLKDNKETEKLAFENIEKPLKMDKQFPDLTLKALSGENVTIHDFKGKILIINWWATGCAPCRKEIPGLNKLVEKYNSNSNIIFLAIAFDKSDILENYLKYNQFSYIQTLGDKKAVQIFGGTFPQHLIMNKNGIIKFYSQGGNEDTYINIEKEIEELIIKN